MAGSITPLPVMLEEEDRKAYENLEPPKTIVVRYGYQRMIGEFPYDGTAKPGCGSKMVVRTKRGVEIGEMLTSTCPNAGCAKSVTRNEMLEYIENSGGKDYPFHDQGKILRVASVEDLNEQARLDARKPEIIKTVKPMIREFGLPMRLVDVELLLGGERIIFYYTAEQWVDFRQLVKKLAAEYQTRIEMHQVNAREEARLVADYEKCGQHCCCKQFLKVLKPVSMRSAKVQKATLDPMKISGRCGRLMCCLRYEDKTYDDLRKNLPHRKSLVETEDGIGLVLDTQILTQLVLVKVGPAKPAAYPVEQLRILDKKEASEFQKANPDFMTQATHWKGPGMETAGGGTDAAAGNDGGGRSSTRKPPRRPKPGKPLKDDEVESKEGPRSAQASGPEQADASDPAQSGGKPKRRSRRRRRRRRGGGESGGGRDDGGPSGGGSDGPGKSGG